MNVISRRRFGARRNCTSPLGARRDLMSALAARRGATRGERNWKAPF